MRIESAYSKELFSGIDEDLELEKRIIEAQDDAMEIMDKLWDINPNNNFVSRIQDEDCNEPIRYARKSFFIR